MPAAAVSTALFRHTLAEKKLGKRHHHEWARPNNTRVYIISMSLQQYMYIYVLYMHIYKDLYLQVYRPIHIDLCIRRGPHRYIYIYTCIYIYIYISICVYIYVHRYAGV